MQEEAEETIRGYRAIILKTFPELSGSRFSLLAMGWDSLAVDVDGKLIFKFPRNRGAREALVMEAALLSIIRPSVSMKVPDLAIHEGPPLFSCHRKLPGDHLLASQYDLLLEEARQRLGAEMGRFYAELHAIDPERIRAAGAAQVDAWQPVDAIRQRALPLLAEDVRPVAAMAVDEFAALPPDPYGTTYGFFDGHGWNMAFDHTKQRLSGIYDFADSGFGPLHQEFIYSNFVSPDLTRRIVSSYEEISGRTLDRRRIEVLTGMHRLSELAELADDPDHVPDMIRFANDWFSRAEKE